MTTTTYTGISATTCCAGQDCPYKDNCQRYVIQPQPNSKWASLDVERLRYGTCQAHIPLGVPKRGRAH